ncbi:MAG: hypothetical protein HFE76_09480 [Firmicutes bacterium]|nr:hypothetical protein [Bacillota bacterium]
MPRTTSTYDGKRYDVTADTPEELAAKVALRKKELEDGYKAIQKNPLQQLVLYMAGNL